ARGDDRAHGRTRSATRGALARHRRRDHAAVRLGHRRWTAQRDRADAALVADALRHIPRGTAGRGATVKRAYFSALIALGGCSGRLPWRHGEWVNHPPALI